MESDPELFNLTTSVELLSLPSNKSSSASSSWRMFHGSNDHFYRTTQISKPDETQPMFSDAVCSSINLKQQIAKPSQQQQLRDSRFAVSNFKDGFFESSKFSADLQHQHICQDGFHGKSPNFHGQQGKQDHRTQFELRKSKYLVPTQELLSEFCSLRADPPKQKKSNQWGNDETAGAPKSSLMKSLDHVELQKRQANLFSMLNEVDQRYRLYCDQIKGVVSSFETVLGEGAATVYSKPASQAMSRHFRCLRDGIMSQIKEIKEAMGEDSDPLVGLSTRRPDYQDINKKTPRLRLIDQSLRKQKSFQQMSMLERQPWRPQRGLPERSVTVLRAWLFEHFLHPYPSDVDKLILARQAGLSRSQVSNWFINARVRLWKPMVEEMYLEETKDQNHRMPMSTDAIFRDDVTSDDDNSPTNQLHFHSKPSTSLHDDHSDSILSIINITGKDHDSTTEQEPTLRRHHHHHHHHHHSMAARDAEMAVGGVFGLDHMESYGHHSPGMLPFASEGMDHQNYRNSVSLTLGLQQHGGGAVNLSFSPVSLHSSFLFPKDHSIEDCQPVQYSV